MKVHSLSGVHYKIQLLWVHRRYRFPQPLSLNIVREVCRYLCDLHIVPCVHNDELRVYYIDSGRVVDGKLSRIFTTAAVPCLLSESEVMYIGNYPPYSAEAFIVNLQSFHTTQILSMGTERGWPGVIRVEAAVYVFGGNNPMLTSSEKMQIASLQWAPIPDMQHGRYSFSPCFYEDEIYLGDYMQPMKVIEAFNVISETYRPLDIPLPKLQRHSMSFILDHEMYIMNLDFELARWKINSSEREFTCSTVSIHSSIDKPYCGCPPLIVGRKVFYANYIEGCLTVFDLDKLEFGVREEVEKMFK